jgi:hypothetical protein
MAVKGNMFSTEIDTGRSFVSWCLQQLIGIVVPLGALALISHGFSRSTDPESAAAAEEVYGLGLLAVAGFASGYFIQRLFPRAVSVGRLVWILPSFVFIFLFLWDCFTIPFHDVLTEFFLPGGNGEAWWVMTFCTFPTWSCVWYSIGVALLAEN